MAEVTYVSREDLSSALDVKASAYMSAQLDRKCASATRMVNAFLRRKPLYPLATTRYWDWPNSQDAGPYRIYFDDRTLISVTTLASGGVTIPPAAYNLEPNGDGPPYDYLELISSGNYSFSGVSTTQRAIAFTGVWGYSSDEDQPATLAALVSSSATSITVTAPVNGVGSLIRIDSERMIITDKTWATPTQSVTNVGGLAADTNVTTVTIADTSTFAAGEVLMIDAERVLLREVVDTTTLIITRAWDGTTLAAHNQGASVRRQLALTVARGAAGTTAASHSVSAPVLRWLCPPLAAELALAYAQDSQLQTTSGYARTVATDEGERPITGAGIRELETRVRNSELSRAVTRFRAV